MAYRRTTARRRSTARGGYGRPASPRRRQAARRSRSTRGRAQRETRIVVEVAQASPVSRPSYLSTLNPALVETALPKKARL